MLFRLLIGSPILVFAPLANASAQTTSDPDALWAAIEQAVEGRDLEAYTAVFHPRAVIVFEGAARTTPLEDEVERFRKGLEEVRDGQPPTDMAVRFTERLHDETTAFETSIIRFADPTAGGEDVTLVHVETLLVKENGNWRFLMIRQKGPATEDEWAVAGAPGQDR